MNSQSRSKLTYFLIAKSIAETLLVGVLAVAFFFVAFPPYFQGWGEATPTAIAGWAVNRQQPSQRVEVQLFIDDQFVATRVAVLPRPDVVTAAYGPPDLGRFARSVLAPPGTGLQLRDHSVDEVGDEPVL